MPVVPAPAVSFARPGTGLRTRIGSALRRLFPTPPAASPDLASAVRSLTAEVRALQAQVRALGGWVEPFHARPGTLDEAIYREVVLDNEYELPETFRPDDVVIDIGCHVGSFATACLLRGAGRVLAFEAEPGNRALAALNLARFGTSRAEVRGVAVWRSDVETNELLYASSPDPANTGGGGVITASGRPVRAVSLDSVLDELLPSDGRVRLLKLDCEGSEYPILLTARKLDRVQEVCGEYHQVVSVPASAQVGSATAYGVADLKRCLEGHGFLVRLRPNPRNPAVGEFFATRPGPV